MALCFILFNGVNFSLDGLVGTAFKLTEIAGITGPKVVLRIMISYNATKYSDVSENRHKYVYVQ